MDAAVKQNDGPDLFNGIALEVEEINQSSERIVSMLRSLNKCCMHKQKIPAKHCAEDIAKAANQLKIMAEHLASVITRNVGSQPKVRS